MICFFCETFSIDCDRSNDAFEIIQTAPKNWKKWSRVWKIWNQIWEWDLKNWDWEMRWNFAIVWQKQLIFSSLIWFFERIKIVNCSKKSSLLFANALKKWDFAYLKDFATRDQISHVWESIFLTALPSSQFSWVNILLFDIFAFLIDF